ncbi:hypothetical protein BDW62DRAFT_177742 [Aspergillus aurantiobrunneus]
MNIVMSLTLISSLLPHTNCCMSRTCRHNRQGSWPSLLEASSVELQDEELRWMKDRTRLLSIKRQLCEAETPSFFTRASVYYHFQLSSTASPLDFFFLPASSIVATIVSRSTLASSRTLSCFLTFPP